MKYLATTGLIMALFAFMAAPALQAQTIQIIDNGTIRTGVFDAGQIGGDCSGVPGPTYEGFSLNGVGNDGTVLCGSGFLLATSPTNVIGTEDKYIGGNVNWMPTTPWAAATSPYSDLEAGFSAGFDDSPDAGAVGVDVVMSVYYSDDDDAFEQFMVVEFEVTNNSGGSLDLTPAQWMDWDVDPFATNDAEHDGANAQWVYGDGSSVTEYFGTVALDGLSGTACSQGFSLPDTDYYTGMTTLGASPCGASDIRGPVGAGTRTVAGGESTTAKFCVIGANDAPDFLAQVANCIAATTTVPPAIEPQPDGTPGTHNLSAVYPNPFNPQARFTLEVAEQQSVRVAVYDALGREVATLYNGTLSAGPAHEFTIDGAGLPSGVYVVRASGEQFTDVRRVTLTK